MEVVPLVQTFGHLEWLLKHDRYAGLREAGFWNLLCPNHADSMTLIANWLDEVIALHPDSRYIHVGLDEVFNLATCPKCVAQGKSLGTGKMGVYLAHARRVCEHVIARGRKPIIWADMFLNHDAVALAAELPRGTVLCDWQYDGAGPFASTGKLAASGCELTGASAVRPGWDPQHEFVSPLQPRILNVTAWHRPQAAPLSAVMHTTWARSRSLLPVFGPWEGWIPAFIKAGRADAELSHAMRRGMEIVDSAMAARTFSPTLAGVAELNDLKTDDPFERQALRWWQLALRHRHELWWVNDALGVTCHQWRAVRDHVGFDPALADLKKQERAGVLTNLDAIEKDVRAFFADNQVSDVEEYVASNIASVRQALEHAEV
jgi:hypothetical protein